MNGRAWTNPELRRLRHFYPHIKTEYLARVLRRALQTTYAKAMSLKLRKTAKYLATPDACRLRRDMQSTKSVACRFRPGHVPANKGLRRPGWHRGRMRETQFKKGQMSCAAQRKWAPVGTEVLDDQGYLKRKISDDRSKPSRFNWRQVHVLLWEATYGPVLPGYALKFIDDDRGNVALNNLCLVSRADLARLNVMWNRYPRALCEVIQMRGFLKRRINRRLKDEEQHRRSA
jgi:hypothetical protein